jgi:hypothetical protein
LLVSSITLVTTVAPFSAGLEVVFHYTTFIITMSRLFGRSRSRQMDDDDGDNALLPPERTVKKSKSFKRIRGLIKKTRSAVTGRNKKLNKDTSMDDQQSLYGIDVDERSVATRPPGTTTASSYMTQRLGNTPGSSIPLQKFILKVVLLLMDPETRRFELLQLEFDSVNSLVSDVLAQIEVSVTEESLRMQTYTGIVGPEGLEMIPTKLLATFCKGVEVFVAVPTGVPPRECVRMAIPILSDGKIVTMVRSFTHIKL